MHKNKLPLRDGKYLYAYGNVLGIGRDNRIYVGYDDEIGGGGEVIYDSHGDMLFKDNEPLKLSREDKIALADLAITRWLTFKAELGG